MLLIIFGAIGFPVLIEVKEYLFADSHKRKFIRFSLFTKVTTSTFLALIIIGTIGMFLLDIVHFFADKSWQPFSRAMYCCRSLPYPVATLTLAHLGA